MLEYWWEVLKAAFWSSIEAIGYPRQVLIYLSIFFALTARFVWLQKGLREVKDNIAKTVVEVIFWSIVSWLPFFAFHIMRTSYLRYKTSDESAELAKTRFDEISKPKLSAKLNQYLIGNTQYQRRVHVPP